MIIPHMTLPEVIFIGFVLACFAAFIVTLAGVHLYVMMPARRRPERAMVAARAAAPPVRDHALAA